jgi:hypothetical protein
LELKEFIAGLKQGVREFDRALIETRDEIDQAAFDKFFLVIMTIALSFLLSDLVSFAVGCLW